MDIQRCVFFTSIAAPDQRPMIRCQRMLVNRDRGIF